MSYIPQDKSKVYYILCQNCSHFHPWLWDGDCYNDSNRFTYEELNEKHGGDSGWDISPCTGLVWVEDGVEPSQGAVNNSMLLEAA